MRVILTGIIGGFRYLEMKGGKVGQIDLIQAGNAKHPAKVIPLYIPGAAYCRMILEHLTAFKEPMISLLAYIKEGRELEIDVQEILTLGGEERDGTRHIDPDRTEPTEAN